MALSYVEGVQSPELWELTIPQLIQQQAVMYGDHEAAVFPWQRERLSYNDLYTRSEKTAKAMLSLGLKHGDSVGIMAGNRCEYIETFLGAGRIGAPYVVLNNTYSPKELATAVKVSCKYSSTPSTASLTSNSLQTLVHALSDRSERSLAASGSSACPWDRLA